jgi:hypothetical protein
VRRKNFLINIFSRRHAPLSHTHTHINVYIYTKFVCVYVNSREVNIVLIFARHTCTSNTSQLHYVFYNTITIVVRCSPVKVPTHMVCTNSSPGPNRNKDLSHIWNNYHTVDCTSPNQFAWCDDLWTRKVIYAFGWFPSLVWARFVQLQIYPAALISIRHFA